jgi:hypothetical protein
MELTDWVYIDQTEFLTIGFLAKDKLHMYYKRSCSCLHCKALVKREGMRVGQREFALEIFGLSGSLLSEKCHVTDILWLLWIVSSQAISFDVDDRLGPNFYETVRDIRHWMEIRLKNVIESKNTSNIRPPTFKQTVVPWGGKICELKITIYTISLTIYASSLSLWSFEHSGPMTFPQLLARVLKEGVQFWYNDTSTVSLRKRSRKRSSGKPLKFTLLHVSICSKLVRNFSNTLGFVSSCRYTSLLNCDIFIQPGTPSKCQMYNNNENWSYFVSDILIHLGK